MTHARIEHVNFTASDAAATADMLCNVFGWQVRWHGPAINDGYTYHVGNDDDYVAVYARKTPDGEEAQRLESVGALNHVGVVVDDLDATEKRVIDAGLTPFNHRDYAPGKRFYFLDRDGVEFEVVSYA